jgi:uncharacterized protein (TIGR00255 family)
MTQSMTAYARADQSASWGTLSWEIRSVNQRYLDPHFRLHEIFRPLESVFRRKLSDRLHRGKLDIQLFYHPETAQDNAIQIDQGALKALSVAMDRVHSQVTGLVSATPLDVLRWPGVTQQTEVDVEPIHEASLELLGQAIATLIENRGAEGARLEEMVTSRCVRIAELVEDARLSIPEIRNAHRQKLLKRIDNLDLSVNEARLEQELVLFAQKMDVDEELDRLESHITAIRDAFKGKAAIGRRLDFLMQECTREANTLASKSQGIATTATAVELKVLVEQMREQIQNIE